MRHQYQNRRDEPRQDQTTAINPLEFSAWLSATYAVDAHALTAEQRAEFENKFEEAAAGWISVTGIAADPIEAGPFDDADMMADPADLEAAQAVTDNQNRITEISEIAMNHLDIAAQAIRQGWSLVQTYEAVTAREAGAFGMA